MHTVPSFLEPYLIPVRLLDASPYTINVYRIAARKFAVTMGNPPLAAITNEMLAKFRETLKQITARVKTARCQ